MTAYELGDLIVIFILCIFLFIAVPLWGGKEVMQDSQGNWF